MIDVPFLLFIFHGAMATTIRQFTGLFEGFSQAAAPVVVTALWQGAVLAAGLAVCLRLTRRVSAGYRFAIWAAGFAALVCMPFLSIWMSGAANGPIATGSMVRAASAGPWLRLDLRWSLVLGAVWIAASVFRAVVLGIHSLRLRRLWKTATPIEDGNVVVSQVPKCEGPGAPGLFVGGSRTAKVCTTQELDRPAVIGFWAPRILIPEWLFERLTPEELEHVILHESEHLRRGDDWINLAQKLCLAVFPLNPALVWMDRRLSSEREMACDEGVVRATNAPRAYAACLASLAERGLKHRANALSGALSLGVWQRRPELVERVHRILRRTPGLSPMATRALVGVLSCGLVFGSIEFARCPQLVAFVPAPRAVAQRSVAGMGDARYVDTSYGLDGHGAAGSGFRAIDAVAQMPVISNRSTRTAAAQQNGKQQSAAAHRNLKNVPHKNLREILLKAEMPGASADEREEQAQTEWIVFTAWEQVEGAGSGHRGWNRDARMRQDYDSVVTDDTATGNGGNQADDNSCGGASGRRAITELIFRIYPASASTASQVSGSAVSSSPNSGPSGDQPAPIPLRDGWFVFQL